MLDMRIRNPRKGGGKPVPLLANEEQWICRCGLHREDVLRLARELVERTEDENLSGVKLLNHCRDVIWLGQKAYRESQHSVVFRDAVEESLRERTMRRPRTVRELQRFTRTMMRHPLSPTDKLLRNISTQDCYSLLNACFTTPHQYAKGRAVLHSIFACGLRHGWCSSNPVDAVQRPELCEKEVIPLPWEQLLRLLHTARQGSHVVCMPALGLMLWAGVRPAEMMRLDWSDLDWEEKVISLRARHSKTGGCRHITLHSVLIAWLHLYSPSLPHVGSICPRDWIHRWSRLRHAAGILDWQPDVLRHTFASYHIKHWHDAARLQEEMGHRSARLLRTRYLSMRGVTHAHARLFWQPELLRRS